MSLYSWHSEEQNVEGARVGEHRESVEWTKG